MSASTSTRDARRRMLPLEQLVYESSVSGDIGGLQDRWTEFLGRFGSDTYWVAPFPPQLLKRPNFPMPRITIANKVPPGWLERYRDGSFIRHDPVILKGLAGCSVFTGKEAHAEFGSPEADRMVAEGLEFGIPGPDGHALLSLSFGPDTRLWATLCLPSSDIDLDATTRLVLKTALFVFYARHQELKAAVPSVDEAPGLTPRELDVLHWIALGKSKQEVADILCVSASCVKRHCENAYQKLGVNTLASAVARAMSRGLINP